jgi:hypothetical protein
MQATGTRRTSARLMGAIGDPRIFMYKRYIENLSEDLKDNSVNYNVLTVARNACTVDLICAPKKT